MALSSTDILKFTKEEKREIKTALNNVLDDLDALWSSSSLESVTHYFDLKGNGWGIDDWSLIIDKNGIRIGDYYKEIVLEAFNKIVKRPKIKDFTEIYYFLRQYEEIRASIERKVVESNREKGKGIEEIINIKDRYAKEATIELDLPDTINPHTIEVTEQDGRAIGEIRLSSGTIRIITKGNIVLTNANNPEVSLKNKQLYRSI